MIVDTVLLEKGLKAAFNKAFSSVIMNSGVTKALESITSILPSEGKDEKYGFLGDIPAVTEWIGDKNAGHIKDHDYTLTNKNYEVSINIDRNEINDDRMGILRPRIAQMVSAMQQHKWNLVLAQITAGTTNLAYDAAAFFATHADPTVDNLLGGTSSTLATIKTDIYSAKAAMLEFQSDQSKVMHLAMDTLLVPAEQEGLFLEAVESSANPGGAGDGIFNPMKGWIKQLITAPSLTDAKDWYGFASAQPLKPMILQMREEPNAVLDTTAEKRNRQMIFSAEMRAVAGYGLFQQAVKMVNG